MPLLNEVGRLVNDGHLSVAQEHAASALMVDKSIRSSKAMVLPSNHIYQKFFSNTEGEIHEFGILINK